MKVLSYRKFEHISRNDQYQHGQKEGVCSFLPEDVDFVEEGTSHLPGAGHEDRAKYPSTTIHLRSGLSFMVWGNVATEVWNEVEKTREIVYSIDNIVLPGVTK